MTPPDALVAELARERERSGRLANEVELLRRALMAVGHPMHARLSYPNLMERYAGRAPVFIGIRSEHA